ncbi:retrovirus-related pol polyprotein from transposon TNT 1-94 [Tanacetum coccineum]|uniref:Retrovirus-related pol polyprotein from transposon TNT 1-94 n=1 Tax=Tanacetum coccineum TaxID=301880 RepID=A0ABQ5H1X4_9ASTR
MTRRQGRKHTKEWVFALKPLKKKHKKEQTTDCHVGNPRELRSDPTDKIELPMIVLFSTFVWRELLGIHGPLVRKIILEFFSTLRFRKGVLDLDATDNFLFQGQAPENVTTTDLFFLKSMDEGTVLCIHFGVITEQSLQTLTIKVHELPTIDIVELIRTDFASWKQRIRLYCRGEENGVNILKSIDEGPFWMGTFRETLAEGTEGAPHLGPERPRVYFDLSPEYKERYNANIRATNILLQGLPKDIYSLFNHYTDAKDIWDNVKMLLEGSELTKEDRESQLYDDFKHFRLSSTDNLIDNLTNTLALLTQSYKTYLPQTNNQLRTSSNTRNQATVQDGRVVVQNVHGRQNRGQGNNARGGGAAGYGGAHNGVGNANPGQARQIKCYNCNGIGHIARNCTQPKHPQNSEYFKDKMLLMQAQENRLALTKEIKEMKDIFEELEAEVNQNVVNRKHEEIERKNLLIANDNLIVDCLSKEVLYIATNSELNCN